MLLKYITCVFFMWDPQILCRAVDLIGILGIMIKEGASVLSPIKKTGVLGIHDRHRSDEDSAYAGCE